MKASQTKFTNVSVGSQPSHNSSRWSKVFCSRCKDMIENCLSDHIESCLGAVLDENTYPCEQCEYNCDSSWSMNNHIDRNHRLHEEGNIDNIAITESSEDRFQCQECDSSFSYIFTLALHIKYYHTSDNVCCECNIG